MERCIFISSYFTATEWQNNWAFYEKEEAQSCGHAYDEDTKLKVAGIYNCVIRLIIAISDQAINYAIPRNHEKLYKSLVRSQLE